MKKKIKYSDEKIGEIEIVKDFLPKTTDIEFMELYKIAMSKCKSRKVSPFIDAGSVAAAILTESGNIYTGICIDTRCSLGICAERSAIVNMISNGESKIKKLVACFENGQVGSPCGACREFMMQLDESNGQIEILIDIENGKTIKLQELIPDWWGKYSK